MLVCYTLLRRVKRQEQARQAFLTGGTILREWSRDENQRSSEGQPVLKKQWTFDPARPEKSGWQAHYEGETDEGHQLIDHDR
jgi:hypothetical protein